MWLMGCERDKTWMPISWRTSAERLAAMERAGLMRGDHAEQRAISFRLCDRVPELSDCIESVTRF